MDLRNKIIDSAFQLFTSKGYEKTTINEIISQAQCSKGGFYHHFKSKEEILEVIVSNYVDTLSNLFKDIVSNEGDSFIDKFNAIFMVINECKLKQLKDWYKLSNLFYFQGNDKIIRQLVKQFKIATTKAYLEVINYGKKESIINIEHPELAAELCTRQVLWIYEAAREIIMNKCCNKEYEFEKLLNFSEDLLKYALGLKDNQIKLKDTALSYFLSAREYYLAHKGESK